MASPSRRSFRRAAGAWEAAPRATQEDRPESLFSINIGGTEFGLSVDGYGERAKETWGGAGVGTCDALTLGLHLSEQDRIDIAHRYGVDPNSGYYAAGQIVGEITTGVAAMWSPVGWHARPKLVNVNISQRIVGAREEIRH